MLLYKKLLLMTFGTTLLFIHRTIYFQQSSVRSSRDDTDTATDS